MTTTETKSMKAARLARDLEIVRRWRHEAPAGGIAARVVAVKDVWLAGVLHQHATVETDRGPATIETMAGVYRGARDIDPGSFIIADWARGASRFVKSIGRVHAGDTVELTP